VTACDMLQVLSVNGATIWGKDQKMAESANWIWSTDTQVKQVICRGYLGKCSLIATSLNS
jgi:hypothetical protein